MERKNNWEASINRSVILALERGGEGKINARSGIINLGARFALKIAPPLLVARTGVRDDNFFAREERGGQREVTPVARFH